MAKSLAYFDDKLPHFVRIHKTALVNPDCVVDIMPPDRPKMPGSLRMNDGTELPVSRRRWPEISEFFQHVQASVTTDALPQLVTKDKITVAPPLVVLAVMSGDALMLTQQQLQVMGIECTLQAVDRGAEVANLLLLNPNRPRPALILLDGRTNRADRMLTLRSLKANPQLWGIPIVWLASPGDDVTPLLELDVNSVVEVPADPTQFVAVIDQLCQYWLMMVQLPATRTVDD